VQNKTANTPVTKALLTKSLMLVSSKNDRNILVSVMKPNSDRSDASDVSDRVLTYVARRLGRRYISDSSDEVTSIAARS